MDDIYIREGATFEETFTDTDITAETLTITVSDPDGEVLISESVSYTVEDDRAVATLSFDVEEAVGNYEYMYTITYADGFELKLPDPQNCVDGDCGLPAFIVCDANDIGESS